MTRQGECADAGARPLPRRGRRGLTLSSKAVQVWTMSPTSNSKLLTSL